MVDAKQIVERTVRDHVAAVEGFLGTHADMLGELAATCAAAFESGKKLLFCGNGGSACDAMHIAGEFVGRFIKDRKALPAIALSSDSGNITALANDYAYDYIFARQVEAFGQPGDVLICLSTSGKSPNVLSALKTAQEMGLSTALFTGLKARDEPKRADFTFMVPSVTTAHVQESHMVSLHALCTLIEAKLFPGL